MSRSDPSTLQPDPETRLLGDFIYELNLSRRHLATYPPGHPLINSSTDQVLTVLSRLFEFRETVTLGVAKETLYVNRQWLDKKNPIFRDLASTLARLGIAALNFHGLPKRAELVRLNQLLCSDRQRITESGGFAALLAQHQISHIEITAVDYSSFRAIEEEHPEEQKPAASLWEDFITSLLSGRLDRNKEPGTDLEDYSPALVAELLNRMHQQLEGSGGTDYDRAISTFIKQSQQPGQLQELARGRFAELIGELLPELRRQFLASTFHNLDPAKETTEEFLSKLPAAALLDALEELNRNGLQPSSTMASLIEKLVENRQPEQQSLISGQTTTSDEQIREQMNRIFQEEQREKFTPSSYQQALNSIVAFEGLESLPEAEAKRLRQQLDNSSTERHSCAIMLRLLRPGLAPEQADALQNNLIDLAHYFLEVGDFRGLHMLHSGVLNYRKKTSPPDPEQTDRLLATLNDEQFQQEVLDNLKRWGEKKQKEIRAYIQFTGATFAASLVQRLATEDDRGLRRLYVNALASMGKAAHQTIYTHLKDRRWYLVRNLLSVLCIQNDPIELEAIYPLKKHPHPRVNLELLKVLFKFERSQADDLLLKQLSSEDQVVQRNAVQLAELSRSSQVVEKLLELLSRDRVTKTNLPLKLGIVKSLGLIGSAQALPELEKQLFSGWLFPSAYRRQLKTEIIRHLANYPSDKVQSLLNKMAKSFQKELRRPAVELLRQLEGNKDGR